MTLPGFIRNIFSKPELRRVSFGEWGMATENRFGCWTTRLLLEGRAVDVLLFPDGENPPGDIEMAQLREIEAAWPEISQSIRSMLASLFLEKPDEEQERYLSKVHVIHLNLFGYPDHWIVAMAPGIHPKRQRISVWMRKFRCYAWTK